MNFTIRGGIVDKQIKKQLNIVCDELKENIPDIKSIILAGSFGYGEGPVKVKKGKIYPFNDYDIYVITSKKISKEKTDEIASKVANRLGLTGIEFFYDFRKEDQTLEKNFYIDLKCMTTKELRKVLPRLRFYRFKEYTTVINGYDLRYLVPEFKLDQIPLSEPAKLLLDRMSQMVEYFSMEENYDGDFLTYIIQQAYAAMSTALMMLAKDYRPSYKENMEGLVKVYKNYFSELNKKLPSLHLRIKKYINWKLNPQKLPDKNVKKVWLTCANDLIEVSKYFFSRFLNKEIQSVDELSKEILNLPLKFYTPYLDYIQKQKTKISLKSVIKISFPILAFYLKYNYYKRLKQMINKKHKKIFLNKFSPDAYIFASVPYILSAITPTSVDHTKLENAKKILNKVYPVKSEDWEELSLEYANAYVAFFLQKIG